MKQILSKLKNGLWLVVMDIIAVNAAFVLALLLRYYVHSELKAAAWTFVNNYVRFAPIYTLLCLVVFYICGLYDGVWRFAGFNDFKRVLLANLLAAGLNVLGTSLLFGGMPKTYYIVGGLLQLLFTAMIRFSYRFMEIKRRQDTRDRTWTIPAMVVGSGDCAREFVHHLEEHSPFQVVAMVGEGVGRTLDGVPIVSREAIPAQVQYHDIRALFIADDGLDAAERAAIRQAAGDIEVRDYAAYLGDMAVGVPLAALLKVVDGPVTAVVDGVEMQFAGAGECLAALGGSCEVKRVTGAKLELAASHRKDR